MDDFRAFKSAVSLKHRFQRRAEGTENRFPRLQKRGLIEADAEMKIGSGQDAHFRAFKSAVSLKHGGVEGGVCGGDGFPRLQKRGLIEAVHFRVIPPAYESISAPSKARSH